MIHGKDLIVTTNVGGSQTAVAACKTCALKVSQEFLDYCSPTEGRTLSKMPTIYGWSISCGCLVVKPQYALQFLEAVKNKTALTVQFDMVGFKQIGTAFVSGWDGSGSVGSLAGLSLEFVGSGPLETAKNWQTIQQVTLGATPAGYNYYNDNAIYRLTDGLDNYFVGQEIRLVPVNGTSTTPVDGTVTSVQKTSQPPRLGVSMNVGDTLANAYGTDKFDLQTY